MIKMMMITISLLMMLFVSTPTNSIHPSIDTSFLLKLVVEGDDEIETEDGMLYSLTPTDEWTRVDDDEDGGRSIDPIE
jgi:hypothetical protein